VQPRYSPFNQALHWITAACMFAILPLAWVMTSLAAKAPLRDTLFNWHKTLGLIVLALTVLRIGRRLVDGPPPYPPRIANWERRVAHAVYILFFLVLLWMPITGFLTSYYGGHPVKLFNLIATPPFLPRDQARSRLFGGLHGVGQWAVYGLIVLHLGAVSLHLIWRRTGLLGRMLPAHATEPQAPQPSVSS
jgi:cytochrome b561